MWVLLEKLGENEDRVSVKCQINHIHGYNVLQFTNLTLCKIYIYIYIYCKSTQIIPPPFTDEEIHNKESSRAQDSHSSILKKLTQKQTLNLKFQEFFHHSTLNILWYTQRYIQTRHLYLCINKRIIFIFFWNNEKALV